MSPERLTLRARRATPAALAWLQGVGPRRVLHVFERACNLVDDQGRLLSLVTSNLAAGPFALVLPGAGGAVPDWGGFQAWVTAETPVFVEGGRLRLGGLTVETGDAQPWDPRPDWKGLRAGLATARRRLAEARSLAARHAPPGAFTALLTAGQHATAPSMQREALAAARAPAAALVAALAAEAADEAAQAAASLAGLGGGLTPSGDDFLVGAMHALWLAWGAAVSPLAQRLAEAAAPRTTLLSAAWLRAAAQGEAGWPWHTLLASLTDPEAGLEAPLRDLASVGHTSGADALAGFLLTMESLK